MSTRGFQFSPAARLYCQNVAVVEEIRISKEANALELYKANEALVREMRDQAYQEIAAFGAVLLEELSLVPWEKLGVRLCGQTTYTVKSWKGQRINYRWLRPAAEQGNGKKRTEGGYVALSFPIPDVVRGLEEDAYLHGYFDIVAKGKLAVGLVCHASDGLRQRLVRKLSQNEMIGSLGEMDEENSWNNLSVSLGPENAIGPLVEKITGILQVIYDEEYPR